MGYMRMSTHICACLYMYVCTFMPQCVYAFICAHMLLSWCVCVYAHTHMHAHASKHAWKVRKHLASPTVTACKRKRQNLNSELWASKAQSLPAQHSWLGTVRISTPVKWKMILENTEAGVCNQSSSYVATWTDMDDCWVYRKRVWIGTVAEFYTDPELLNSYWGSVPAQTQSKRLALGQHVPAQTPHSSLRALPLPLAMDYNNLC